MLGWWLPENGSIDGGVFLLLYWSSAIAMIVVQALLSRQQRPALGGIRARAVVWALVPVLLLLGFGVVSHRAASAIAAARPQVACENGR